MPLQTALPLFDEGDFDSPWMVAGLRRRGRADKEPRRRRREPRGPRSDRFTALQPLDVGPVGTGWGPMAPIGSHLRMQARDGYRGAVVELQPGLYLVAEVPSEALRPEFGFVPLLASVLTASAAKALKGPRPTAASPAPAPASPPWWAPPLPWSAPAQPDPEPSSLLEGFRPRTCRCGGRR